MKLSLGTRIPTNSISGKNGYGYATLCMVDSLNRLGYQIEDNAQGADVEIWFDQPQWWEFQPGTYKIGYHPWESTELLPGWAEIMNQCDEIWTPSPLIADWYKTHAGITVPVYVYEHGVDHVWQPRTRERTDMLRFLHVGGEATRKGGWDTMNLFRQAFPKNNDVEFTLKISQSNWLGLERIGKTNIINKLYSFEDLQELYYSHHAYVYPSYGEGFGLTPLQAMATGMPTIIPTGWAPYARFVDPNLAVPSTLKPTQWPEIHPGKMLRPSHDDVIDNMRYVYSNWDKVSAFAMSQTEAIHREYDWDTITKEVFGNLENRLKSS